jgi:hypothetical protein
MGSGRRAKCAAITFSLSAWTASTWARRASPAARDTRQAARLGDLSLLDHAQPESQSLPKQIGAKAAGLDDRHAARGDRRGAEDVVAEERGSRGFRESGQTPRAGSAQAPHPVVGMGDPPRGALAARRRRCARGPEIVGKQLPACRADSMAMRRPGTGIRLVRRTPGRAATAAADRRSAVVHHQDLDVGVGSPIRRTASPRSGPAL